MKKYIILVFILLNFYLANAQFYSTGQDRASLKWREITTEKFQLIYPDYFEEEGQRIANLVSELYECSSKTLEHKPKKVSILFHTESAKSNGYVVWAPHRSELYTTPSNATLSNDWLEHLAIHEFRHIVQIDKIEQGLPKILNYLFGEQIVGAVLGLNVPLWFMEGDAVLQETLLTQSGRGRSANFLQVLRAELLSKTTWYDYDKAILGSYKDFVPNQYHLGYFLVANTRKNYGATSWAKVLENVGQKPYAFNTFASELVSPQRRKTIINSLKNDLKVFEKKYNVSDSSLVSLDKQWANNVHKNAGITLYNDNMTELRTRWQQEQSLIDTTVYQIVSPPKGSYINYTDPNVMSDSSIIAVKAGLGFVPQFVRIKDGKEEVIYVPGANYDSFSVTNHTLMWTEILPDMRWQEAAESVIYTYNLDTKKKERLDLDYNLSMPSFNKSMTKLVAVTKLPNYLNQIVVYDLALKEKIFSYTVKRNIVIDPIFINDNEIAFILIDEGAGIVSLALDTKEQELLLPFENVPLADLAYRDGALYYTASYDGQNNAYKLTLEDGKLEQLTVASYGAINNMMAHRMLYYANYTANGYEIVKTPNSKLLWQEVETSSWKDDYLLRSLSRQEKCEGKIDKTNESFVSKEYSKLGHLLNFHSWSPITAPYENTRLDIGISAQSQNLLSTMFINAGYRKDDAYKNGAFFASVSYKGWYPILSTEINYGKKENKFYSIFDRKGVQDTALIAERSNQWIFKSTVSLPLDLSRGRYYRALSLRTSLEISRNQNTTHTYEKGSASFFKKGELLNLPIAGGEELVSYELSFANMQQKSLKDLWTSFGQQFSLAYYHSPFRHSGAYSYKLEGSFFLPSIVRHHGWKIYTAYQKVEGKYGIFSNKIHNPRGTTELFGEHNYSYSLDYIFPLAYPDYALGGLFYVKRIRGGLFYDIATIKGSNKSQTISSFGLDLLSDTHILRLPIPSTVGVRLGYENQSKSMFSQLLLRFQF